MPDSNDPLEQFFLYDGKELLVQKLDHDHIICQSTAEDKSQTYTVLVREWRADTWEFGTLYEVTFDKLLTCASWLCSCKPICIHTYLSRTCGARE